MNDEGEIERRLAQTPVPTLREGPHREQLKARLLGHAQFLQPRRNDTHSSLVNRIPPVLKLAAALALAALLVGTGWAAERIYAKLTRTLLVVERYPVRQWKTSDGQIMASGGMHATTVAPANPQAIRAAQGHHEEMKELIARKKGYRLVNTLIDRDGVKQYLYSFTFADGSQAGMNFSMPLEEVTSWDDYLEKDFERQKQRQERINRAMAAGHFRLIDADVTRIHVCRDKDSGEKIKVQRLARPDGKDAAVVYPYDIQAAQRAATMPRTSWQEHLQAIREGKRELLSLEAWTDYVYEVVLEDGSKTIYRHGREPLKRPGTG